MSRTWRRVGALLLWTGGFGWGAPAMAAPPEPPISVRLRLLSADQARGRYRVEVRLQSGTALEAAALILRVQPRGAPASSASGRAAVRESREALSLPAGRELRREVEVLTGAQEPVTLLVGLGGRLGSAQLHRTRGLDLGPDPAPADGGRVRTDQRGRGYYEVPMREQPR